MIEIYQRHALSASAPPYGQHHADETTAGVEVAPVKAPSVRHAVLHMYVFPRRSETEGLRISGYWTSFELYERRELLTDRSGN